MATNDFPSPVEPQTRRGARTPFRGGAFAAGVLLAGGVVAVLALRLRPDNYGAYMGAGLAPSAELTTSLAPTLARMKAAGLCNVWWRVRMSKMGMSDGIVVESCAGERAGIDKEPTRSIALDSFAVVARDGALLVVTRGARGSSTLDEYARTIPTILDRVIAAWPAALAEARASQANIAAAQAKEAERQHAVEKSFAR